MEGTSGGWEAWYCGACRDDVALDCIHVNVDVYVAWGTLVVTDDWLQDDCDLGLGVGQTVSRGELVEPFVDPFPVLQSWLKSGPDSEGVARGGWGGCCAQAGAAPLGPALEVQACLGGTSPSGREEWIGGWDGPLGKDHGQGTS